MWKLRIETDQGQLDWAPLDTPVITLGRAESCEVRLRERNISRRHASLRRGPQGTWLLLDHDSYNGSFVNGRRLVGESPLTPRDLVQIGDYFLSIDAGAEPDVGATLGLGGAPASVPASTSHRLSAVASASGSLPDVDLGKGQLTIGSFDDCTLRIQGAALGGVRVRLRPLAGERYEILDESERSSMLVNGVELRRKVLETGDLVELGDALMLGLDARLACSLRYTNGVRVGSPSDGGRGSAPWAMAARPAAGEGRKRTPRPRVARGERPPSERVEEAQVVLRTPIPEPDGALRERVEAFALDALAGHIRLPPLGRLSEFGEDMVDRGAELAHRARRAGASLPAGPRIALLVFGAFVGGLLLLLLVVLTRGPKPHHLASPRSTSSASRIDAVAAPLAPPAPPDASAPPPAEPAPAASP
ncbi:MAG: FHA domain-containing protein [Polyangiaceae bacterium]|jgi:hypothetical protein|nr:FHA domain-containing protein [Polyangiaceae bacterium]